MRLIDADALFNKLNKEHEICTMVEPARRDTFYMYALDVARNELTNAPTVMQWVSMEDKLPEERTSNLVVVNPEKKHIWIAFYCKNRFDQQEWRIDGDCLKTDKISHWMPLPPLPEKYKPAFNGEK